MCSFYIIILRKKKLAYRIVILLCLAFYHKAFEHTDEYSCNLSVGHYATDDAKH